MSKNQQISSFLGFYFIIGTPLSEAISYLLQYDHVIPEADARHLINTYYHYLLLLYQSILVSFLQKQSCLFNLLP